MSIHLQVSNPGGTSRSFELTEHDTFLLGRMNDCHLCLPDDPQVSRHHFLLEACPPQAALRDLGSMNGTHVNGKKVGGREKGESPEQGAKRAYPSIDLKHGDHIQVGQTRIDVRILSDFGLAKNFQKAGLSGMSITGQYAGTPVFMPPEQIVNFKYVKPVSDVWSFAASLYHALTGKFPYRFDGNRDPIDIILNENPVPIRERMPGLEKNLAAIIDRSLLRTPKDRFPDAAKLLAAIQ